MRKMIGLLSILAVFTSLAHASYKAPPYLPGIGGTGSSSQTPSMACFTDGSGDIQSNGTTTATELGFVHGLTSSAQAQLNALAASISSGANTSLSNLVAPTAIAVALLPNTTNTQNIGSSGDLWASIFATTLNVSSLAATGSSISLSSPLNANSNAITGLPAPVNGSDASTKTYTDSGLALKANALNTVTNGGDANYTILSTDYIVRAGTPMTAARTYTLPSCTGNGKPYEIVNPPTQTHVLTVSAQPSELIGPALTYVLNPGDGLSISCDASAVYDIL